MTILLELKGIGKQFGGLTAVNNMNIDIKKDSISGLIGPNGAGKTTIFNIITGIYRPTSGEILFEGRRIDRLQSYQIAELGITRTFQNIRLFKKLSTYENILAACHQQTDYSILDAIVRNKSYSQGEEVLRQQVERLLDILELKDRREVIAGNLPYGLQRRLEIARALALGPKLLLLDEPAAGMNPEETLKLMQLIKELKETFKFTVLVIEHHMDLIMGICEKIVVINFGKKLAEGTSQEIKRNPKVIEAYLGEEDAIC